MSRQQVLFVITLVIVLAWSVVMAALGYVAAIAALVPSLVLIVQQFVQAGRQSGSSMRRGGGIRSGRAPGRRAGPLLGDEEHAG